jgi:Beta/Gamma crystallin
VNTVTVLFFKQVHLANQRMKRVHLLFSAPALAVVALLFSTPAQAQVQFFSDPNYGGKSGQFEASSYNTLGIGLDGMVSSVRIPHGYTVEVFDQAGLRGHSLRLTADVARLDHWNDRIRSARVVQPYAPSPPPSGQVQLFDGAGYTGSSRSLPAGNYPLMVLYDRRISALQIPRGYSVVVFDQPNFRGSQLRLAENTASMASFGWDNRARSIQINASNRPQPTHK